MKKRILHTRFGSNGKALPVYPCPFLFLNLKLLRSYLKLLLVMMMLMFANGLSAQDTISDEELYDMDLEALMNIKVVSASKISQTQSDAPNIIGLVHKDQISDYGWLSLNDVLESQPGYFPAQDYDRRVLGFRGMSEGWNNNHLLMLVDGIPFNDNLYGTAYTWEITPLVFTNTLEIIRGPGGALYGTNAMNGVITMNTMKASDIQDVGMARVRFGQENTQVYDAIVGNENEKIGMVLALNHFQTEGNSYDSYDVWTMNTQDKRKVLDDRNSTYLFAHIYGKDKFQGLAMQYHEQHWEYKTGHGWLFAIPDMNENMREYRRMLSLKYAPKTEKAFNFELASKYQIHGIDWNMRFQPSGAADAWYVYPNGMNEYLKTDAEDIWLRLQADYNLKEHIFIAGVEGNSFIYDGDEAHYSNLDMNTWAAPDSNNIVFSLNPWFEYVKNKPVNNIAAFAQYMSPKFADKLQLTISGRYDQMNFDYINIFEFERPVLNKTFSMFTPRVALIYALNQKLSLKAIYGQAFRTPAPTEMFGSNTFTLASNIEELKPEVITNFDFGLDFKVNSSLQSKLNVFWVNFENQIAYSMQNANLSTNIFTYETAGFEAELQYSYQKLSGFANVTIASRMNENIEDTTIAEHPDEVTWAPATLANLGIKYGFSKFYITLTSHYQDNMLRRDTDKYTTMEDYRTLDKVEGWINLNMRAAFRFNRNLELAMIANNLTDSEQFLIKNYAYPFDYQRAGRQVFVEMILKF